MKKPELTVTCDRIIAIGRDGVHYVWNGMETDFLKAMEWRHAYEAKMGVRTNLLHEVHAEYNTGHAWIFFVADCFDPPLYLVFGDNFSDAHSTFETECERLVKIDAADLKDYGENYDVNDNGTPVDTEAVQAIEVFSMWLESSSVAST